MSFTTEIKQDIAFNELKKCCSRAELSALIQLTSSLTIENRQLGILVRTENPTTAKRIVALLKKLYKAKTDLVMIKKTNLKKNNIYSVKIIENARDILEDLGIYSSKGLATHPSYTIVLKDCCARAYVAGAFLAYGACNSPNNNNYHLEISLNELDHANFIVKLISRFNIEAKISIRRNKYIVYIKRADLISDFLKLVGASDSMLKFEDIRMQRDLKNSVIRLDNCEIANEVKTINAAKRQVESFIKIKESRKYEVLNEKLKNVLELRLKFQEYSLLELCDAYQKSYGDMISKSGMKHRLNKLESIAENLD